MAGSEASVSFQIEMIIDKYFIDPRGNLGISHSYNYTMKQDYTAHGIEK